MRLREKVDIRLTNVLEPLLGEVVFAVQGILVNGHKVPITSTSFTGLVILCTCVRNIYIYFLKPCSLLFMLRKRGKQAMV